ncbi:MAG: ATP-grasp domain-containing protein [Bacteroidaceae bacterium]|nr:ATP-grasp domain-containing protein [Bacteroidaceae bacterium]
MKKILVLGGDHFTIPVVEAAHKQGYYVITCDYLPDNVAHKYSDEFINFSTTDKEGILEWAKSNPIDGVVTFTDSGVVTTAYLQHHLGLPQIGPLKSVEILQNKARFRKFLTDNGFIVPKAKGFSNKEDALTSTDFFMLPVIVKPVDAAGSKGVTKVSEWSELEAAIDWAIKFSFSGDFIIESFIEKQGCSSDSDCFSVNGQFKFLSFSAQRFDEKAAGEYTPAAYSWPSTLGKTAEEELSRELQRLITLLGMKTTVYNVETRVGTDGKPYIMEISPRGGGNRLSEMMRLATGVDMITAAVRAAVGDTVLDVEQKPLDGNWAEIIVHADTTGILDCIEVNPQMESFVKEKDFWFKKGDSVREFQSARDAIGTLVLKFDDAEKLEEAIASIKDWLSVRVKK